MHGSNTDTHPKLLHSRHNRQNWHFGIIMCVFDHLGAVSLEIEHISVYSHELWQAANTCTESAISQCVSTALSSCGIQLLLTLFFFVISSISYFLFGHSSILSNRFARSLPLMRDGRWETFAFAVSHRSHSVHAQHLYPCENNALQL